MIKDCGMSLEGNEQCRMKENYEKEPASEDRGVSIPDRE